MRLFCLKVALIMGVMGACRSTELHAMRVEDVKIFDGCIQILIPHLKTKIPRNFTVTGHFYELVKKYADLRPQNTPSSSFFLNFQNGVCTRQIIGINKFGAMGKEIAKCLGLPNPEKYTGHCLRRSSGTLYVDGGATVTAVKRQGRSKSEISSSSMDADNCESNTQCTPAEIQEASKAASQDLLPEKSRKCYQIAYNAFIEWQQTNGTDSFSEDTLLTYFNESAKKYKSTTLWAHYSMLKSTLNSNHGVNIEPYARVRELLKRQSEGYQPKKSEAFSGEEISKFIREAPDNKYLATKVALIMGVRGACLTTELHAMKTDDVKFFDGCVQIFVPRTKTKLPRNFTITGSFYGIVKKYADLRSPSAPSNSFFLRLQNGKCTKERIGINKFGAMGKKIAKFLGLPNPEGYTAHCLRRWSGILYVDGEATMAALKRY